MKIAFIVGPRIKDDKKISSAVWTTLRDNAERQRLHGIAEIKKLKWSEIKQTTDHWWLKFHNSKGSSTKKAKKLRDDWVAWEVEATSYWRSLLPKL